MRLQKVFVKLECASLLESKALLACLPRHGPVSQPGRPVLDSMDSGRERSRSREHHARAQIAALWFSV